MDNKGVTMKSPIPIFRIFDEAKAREFYMDFLKFQVDWEHRFEDGFPLYMQISCGECVIHLTEHHGDSNPGSTLRVEVSDIYQLHTKLLSKNYKYARPGIEATSWNSKEVCIKDPFGNKIVFYQYNC